MCGTDGMSTCCEKEEILHQLVDGLSPCSSSIHSLSWVPKNFQLVHDFVNLVNPQNVSLVNHSISSPDEGHLGMIIVISHDSSEVAVR